MSVEPLFHSTSASLILLYDTPNPVYLAKVTWNFTLRSYTVRNRQIKMRLKYSVLQYIVVTDVLLIIGLILIFQQVTPENCPKKQQEVKICVNVAPPAKGWEMQDWFKHNQIYVQSCNMKIHLPV